MIVPSRQKIEIQPLAFFQAPSPAKMQTQQTTDMIIALYRAAEVTKEINLSGLRVESLPPFPADLKKLVWSGSYQSPLVTLPPLPETLETLIINIPSLMSLPRFPASLRVLDCATSTRLTSLPPLPSSLIHLNIRQTQIRRIPPLPHKLVYLNCNQTPVQQLPELPHTLQQLWLEETNVTILPYLPRSIKFLATHMTPLLYIRTAEHTMGQYRNLWNSYHQKQSRVRCQQRTALLRQEIIAKSLHPDRVEKWLEQGGHYLVEMIMGC